LYLFLIRKAAAPPINIRAVIDISATDVGPVGKNLICNSGKEIVETDTIISDWTCLNGCIFNVTLFQRYLIGSRKIN
jgi:hypothetical protein